MKNILKEKFATFYEKNVKKTKDCPACKGIGKLAADNNQKLWHCSECGYSITYDKLDNCTYWFCNECETFLNIQPGFESVEERWICQVCGYENDIIAKVILGQCKDCGKPISNNEQNLCAECKQIRKERKDANLIKAKALALKASKAILVIAATIVLNIAKKTISDFLKNVNVDCFNDSNTRAAALESAKTAALSQMSAEMQGCIVKTSGSVDTWLTGQLDNAFNQLLVKVK